jgi:hypothetical protein
VCSERDAGRTWAFTGLAPATAIRNDETDPAPVLAISPAHATDGTIFAGTSRGLFRSTDGAATWDDGRRAPRRQLVEAVAVSPDFANDGLGWPAC